MEKFVRFALSGIPMYGLMTSEGIEIYDDAPWCDGRLTGRRIDPGQVKILPPVEPGKIILVGLNYRAHVKESQSATEVPQNPVIFMKPTTSLIGPHDKIIYPEIVDRVDYEAELAVIIGKQGRDIPQDGASDYIFGYTCLNDVTARKVQKADGQWTRGKGFDTFCPIGPWVVRGVDAADLAVEAYLNGVQKQCGRTSDMIFPVPYLIQFISTAMTLMPGDIISTGTPQGIDPMQRGDTIEVRIEQIGSLINSVV